jgi:transposase
MVKRNHMAAYCQADSPFRIPDEEFLWEKTQKKRRLISRSRKKETKKRKEKKRKEKKRKRKRKKREREREDRNNQRPAMSV